MEIPDRPLTASQASYLGRAKTVTIEQFAIAREILRDQLTAHKQEKEDEFLLRIVEILATNYSATVLKEKD